MTVNYRGLIEVLAIALLLIVACAFISPSSSAENVSVEGVDIQVNTPVPTIVPVIPVPLDYIPRIAQGDEVWINDTVDISGVTGWPDGAGEYRLLWYGSWVDIPSPGDIEPRYTLVLPGKYRSSKVDTQYRYYIDPAIFKDRPGYWYQWISNASRAIGAESAGNLRAFKVNGSYRQYFNTTSNQTEGAYIGGNYTERVIPPAPLMPEKHVADYVVAKGDAMEWPIGGEYRMWIFGRAGHVYGKTGNYVSAEEIETLENGDYNLWLQYPGNNTIYDATYENDTLVPGLYGRKPVDLYGLQPLVVQDRLWDMLADTDDVIEKYKIEVGIPSITMERADEMTLRNGTVLDVRGYTNVANGTPIMVSLDETTYYGHLWIANTTAVRTSPGNMSYYRAYVPVDWENLAADARNHTLIARTMHGGEVQHDATDRNDDLGSEF